MLEKNAVEHGEDGLLLGLGEASEAFELALELGGGPALAGARGGVGDAEEDVQHSWAAREHRRTTTTRPGTTSGRRAGWRNPRRRCRGTSPWIHSATIARAT